MKEIDAAWPTGEEDQWVWLGCSARGRHARYPDVYFPALRFGWVFSNFKPSALSHGCKRCARNDQFAGFQADAF